MLRQAQHERSFVVLTKLVSGPFALSSPRSGRVEGLSTCQLPDLGSTINGVYAFVGKTVTCGTLRLLIITEEAGV